MKLTGTIGIALQRLGALLAMTTLAACGGSGGDSQCSPVVAIVTAGFGCLSGVTVSSPPPPPAVNPPPASPPPPSPPPPPSSNVVRMTFHVEYEPNNTLDNANPVSFRSAAVDEHIGIDITGTVDQTEDAADFFIFTPPRSGQFLVYLCADTCADALQSDEIYLMVYDQSQTTITSTPVGTVETQRLGVDLVAGLAYYVEVNGYMSTATDYKLVIID